MAAISGLTPAKPPRVERCRLLLGRWPAAVVAFLAASPSCGLLFPRHESVQNTSSQPSTVLVEVESHNWSDVTVYLLAGGLPQRLGMVTALGQASFDFPSQRLYTSGGVRLRALPMAGQPFTTETILVLPGQVISWTLENNLDASSFSVY
jgi:hypothetical protein